MKTFFLFVCLAITAHFSNTGNYDSNVVLARTFGFDKRESIATRLSILVMATVIVTILKIRLLILITDQLITTLMMIILTIIIMMTVLDFENALS